MLGNVFVYLFEWVMYVVQSLFAVLDTVADPLVSWLTIIMDVILKFVLMGSNVLPEGFLAASGVVTTFIIMYRLKFYPVMWLLGLIFRKK